MLPAFFPDFSRTANPESRALDAVDQEIREKFGAGKYGLFDFAGPRPPDRRAAERSRIATVRWWNGRAAQEAAKDFEFFHKILPGVPVMTYNFCYMYGLNYIDVPQLTRFTDITSSDPYPTATLSHFGKERALYHTGFATKYLKELSKKPVATMPQGFIYCGMEPTPEQFVHFSRSLILTLTGFWLKMSFALTLISFVIFKSTAGFCCLDDALEEREENPPPRSS